jgi:hypothetical protein
MDSIPARSGLVDDLGIGGQVGFPGYARVLDRGVRDNADQLSASPKVSGELIVVASGQADTSVLAKMPS